MSPKEILPLIENAAPVEAFNLLARLNLAECQFTPQVDDRGSAPLLQTGMSGFGQPQNGFLAFTIRDVVALQQEGKRAILVSDGQEDDRKQTENKYIVPDGDILISRPENGSLSWYNEHFLVNSACSKAVLLDNPAHPSFALNPTHTTLNLRNGSSLHAGEAITIDPIAGKLWAGIQPILPPPDDASALKASLQTAFSSITSPRLTFHSTTHADLYFISGHSEQHDLSAEIGLYRTEAGLRSLLCNAEDGPAAALKTLQNGVIPPALKNLDQQTFAYDESMTYRLADLHSVSDLIPPELADEMAQGLHHRMGSATFKLRHSLYAHQFRQALSGWGTLFTRQNPKTIIIPDVIDSFEVRCFKTLVQMATHKYVPQESRSLIKFGVMIETAEALQDISSIAPLCDKLCFGTNDLTAALTGLSRSQLDHSAWMQDRGYAGRSPFEVLVPEVITPLTVAISAARAANPGIQLSICGYQVGGHDSLSQLAALALEIDELVIPPNSNSVLRSQATLIRHKAGFSPL